MDIIASFIECTVKTKNEKSNFDATQNKTGCDIVRLKKSCDTDKLFILITMYIEYKRLELQHLRV